MGHSYCPFTFINHSLQVFLKPFLGALAAKTNLIGARTHTIFAAICHRPVALPVAWIEIGAREDAGVLIDECIVVLHLVSQFILGQF